MREEMRSCSTNRGAAYEHGALSDWEMRIVKEFYKAFNVAVEQRTHGAK